MSDLRVPVTRYESEPHPNADALELAVVGGWRVCCRIGDFTAGQKVAHIPEQSVLPADLIEEMGLADPPRLAGSAHNRVKAIRLRGVVSQGLIYAGPRIDGLEVGDDAGESLDLTKWEPPIPVSMTGLLDRGGPKISFDVEDVKSFPGVLTAGETVVVTEKLHGTCCCIGWWSRGPDPEPVAASKGRINQGLRFRVDAPENDKNVYVRAFREHAEGLRAAWEAAGSPPEGFALFGEIVGPGIQDLKYDLSRPEFKAFGAWSAGRWLDWDETVAAAETAGAATVPALARGEWSESLIDELTSGQSAAASHLREGIVIQADPVRYDWDSGLGRVIVKSVSPKYLFRKGGTEHN